MVVLASLSVFRVMLPVNSDGKSLLTYSAGVSGKEELCYVTPGEEGTCFFFTNSVPVHRRHGRVLDCVCMR